MSIKKIYGKANKLARMHVSTLGLACRDGKPTWDPGKGGCFGLVPAIEGGKDMVWPASEWVKPGDDILFAMPADADKAYAALMACYRFDRPAFGRATTNKAGLGEEELEKALTDEAAIAYRYAGKAFASAKVRQVIAAGGVRLMVLTDVAYLASPFDLPDPGNHPATSLALANKAVREAYREAAAKTSTRAYTKNADAREYGRAA